MKNSSLDSLQFLDIKDHLLLMLSIANFKGIFVKSNITSNEIREKSLICFLVYLLIENYCQYD